MMKRAARMLLDWEEKSIPEDQRHKCAEAAFDNDALECLFTSGCNVCQAPLVSLVYDVGESMNLCPVCASKLKVAASVKPVRMMREEDIVALRSS